MTKKMLNDLRCYLTEFLGTFFLVLAVVSTGNPLAVGLMLMVMVYMGGHISGGHYNPAVTLTAWIYGKVNAKTMGFYWFTQLLAGFLASGMFKLFSGRITYLAPSTSITLWQAGLVEVLGTFIWCIVVIATMMSKKLKGNDIYGFAIGMALAAAAFMGGTFSGGAFNPAVGLGPIFFDAIYGGKAWSSVWLYSIAPLLGGVLAAYIYCFINDDASGKK